MIVKSTNTGEGKVQELGGKGMNLLFLRQQGFPVPEFVILPVSFFDDKEERQLRDNIKELLPEIRSLFTNGNNMYAVRSSAVAEDSDDFSFAGQFRSVLNVNADQLADSIIEVWQSAGSSSLNAYKAHASISDIPMAVVIQQMVPATAAGVAFGVDPLTGEHIQTINAVEGLGESLVSGVANADSYRITPGGIVEKQLLGAGAILNDSQVNQVAASLTSLLSLYGKAQDIEFAFVQDAFYLLQSRPVTVRSGKEKIVWDNSNIIESYPGLTLPLTFTFIEKMYEAVYVQLSKVLGITNDKITKNARSYSNMLGLLNGRVYYNLNSWYKVLSLLPGYKLNAEFMERMMGVKNKPAIEMDSKNRKSISDYLEVIRAAGYIVKNLATIKKQKEVFARDFNEIFNRFDNKDYDSNSITDIWKDYNEFEQMMVQKWKAPLVNDFFAMIYFGVLQKLCAGYFRQHPDIHNQLIASSKDIITTEPIKRLPGLVSLFTGNELLRTQLLNSTPLHTWQVLQQPVYRRQLDVINDYLAVWGERCIAELKLETITYSQEPAKLISILKSYAANDYHAHTGNIESDKARIEAERIVEKELGSRPLKKMIFHHVLRNARYLVSNRENLRYYRTRGFGMVRRMMTAIGSKMKAQGLISDKRDVFYLRLDEIGSVARGENQDVDALVAARKADYILYEQLPLPERIETYGNQDKIVLPVQDTGTSANNGVLQGIPCSAGVVQAKVKLMHYADELNSLDREVMATYATDPGWVVLFPSVSGILTERGSLLSHAAIVSREMGIPCIVGIEGLMNVLKDGDEIIMDGSTGVIKIIGSNRVTA